MGITSQIVEPLAREHVYKPLRGDALFIGRQTIYYTAPAILQLLHEYGIEPGIDPAAIEIDLSTVARSKEFVGEKLITDVSLMKLFGLTKVMALDHSSRENADLIHDLCYPVPKALCESADILIDGSTLDNVFTPSIVLQNFTRLLRPGGRMFLINAYSSFESAYVIMPPMWYVDYFVMNGFADCRVYVMLYSDQGCNVFSADLKEVHRLGIGMGFFPSARAGATIVFAEKGEASTSDRLPIQQHYRPPEDWQIYNANLSAMLTSKRPHLSRSNSDLFILDVQGGYRFINQNFIDDHDAAFARVRGRAKWLPRKIRRRLVKVRDYIWAS
jgi:hypothetical protein